MQNKYEVIGIVGEGAYGVVYKCKNKETKEYVAIKRFKETKDDIVKKTMRRELAMLKLLKHENVVDFLDCFKNKGNLYLVFEYVERTLLELLEEKPGGLHPSLIKKLMFQLCKAIKYLHDQNIIHRDIKPENLLINNQMQLKLCDFGFARKITMKANENLTDYVATRWYRSPELLITNGYYGTEVDYWAIGCIMGELADGNPLFPGENETDQLHCIQKVLGNLPQEQVNVFYKNPLYIGKRLLDVDKPETLKKRYMGKLPKIAIDFMEGLLELDPKKRLNGNNVFSHPYFQGMENNNTNNSNVTSVKNSVIMTPYKHKIALSVEDKGTEKQMQQQHVHFNTNSNREYKDKVNNNSITMNNNNTFTKFNNSSNKNNQTTYNTTNINIINYNYNNSESNNTHNQHKNIFKKILFNTNPNNKTPSHNNNNNNNTHNISNSIILTTPKVGMMTLGNNFPINSNNKNNILKYITTPSNNQHSQKHEMSSSLTSFVHFNKSKYNSPPIISISPTHTNYNGKNKTFFVDNKGNYGSNPYPKPLRTSENNNNVIYEDAEFPNDNKYKNKYIFHGSNKKYFGYNNNNNTKYSNGHNNGIMSYYNGGINTKGYFGGGNNKFQLPSLGTMYKGNYNHLYNNHNVNKKYYNLK